MKDKTNVAEVLKYGTFIKEIEPIEVYQYQEKVFYYNPPDKEFVHVVSVEAYADFGLRSIDYEIIAPYLERHRDRNRRIGGIRCPK